MIEVGGCNKLLRQVTLRSAGKALACSILIANLGVLGCSSDNQQTSGSVETHLERSRNYQQQHQYRAAIIEARNAIQMAPENPAGHIQLAELYDELGQGKAALNELKLVKNDHSPQYLLAQVNAYLTRGKYASAWSTLEHNPNLSGSTPNQITLLKARAKLGLREYQEAESLYSALLKSTPDNTEALMGLAKVRFQTGKLAEATAILKQISGIDPDNTQALVLESQIALRQGNLEHAEDTLNSLLLKLPSSDIITPVKATTLQTLIKILTNQGRTNEALAYTKLLAEAMPGAQAMATKLSQAQDDIKANKLADAKKLLVQILDDAPDNEEAGTLMGIVEFLQGNAKEAETYFSKYVDPEVSSDTTKQVFALAASQLNQPKKVLNLLQGTVKDTKDPKLLELYGMAALYAGNPSDGVNALNKALSLDPKASESRLLLAKYYNTNHAPQKALEQLETAFKETPENADIQKALLQQLVSVGNQARVAQVTAYIEKNYSNHSDSAALLGAYNLYTKQYAQSLKWADKALSITPDSKEAQRLKGDALIGLKRADAAKAYYTKVISQYPHSKIGYSGLLSAYSAEHDANRGVTALESLKNADAGNVHSVLAAYFIREKQFDKATHHLDLALQNSPDDIDLKHLSIQLAFSKAQQEIRDKQYPAARSTLFEGLQLTPNNPHLLQLLTDLEIEQKNTKEARKLITQIKSANSTLADEMEGDLANAEGDSGQALKHYRLAWDKSPNLGLAVKIYNVLLPGKNKQQIGDFINQWSQKLPASKPLLLVRGNFAMANGQYQAAIEDYQHILARTPNSPVVLNNLAWIYQQLGNTKNALSYAEKAYTLAPNTAAIADTYGWALFKSGQTGKAAVLLKKASDLAPDDQEIRKRLDTVKSAKASSN